MWTTADVRFELDDAATDAPVVTVIAHTPVGALHVMAELVSMERRVEVVQAHTFGPGKGALGVRGLRTIAQAFVEQFDVEELIIAGATRTTGANPGRKPKPFRYRRR